MNPLNLLLLLVALQQQPVEGPISDMIGNRVDKLATRVEAWKVETEQAQQSRFAEMMQAIADARNERKTILDSIQELRGDREGIFAEITEFRKDRDGIFANLKEVREEIRESVGKWTPIQNLVDRLTALVWKLFWLTLSVIIITVIVGSIGLFLYVRLRWKITTLVRGK